MNHDLNTLKAYQVFQKEEIGLSYTLPRKKYKVETGFDVFA
jgi:hypothetical protein